jgi:hypothetical protein
VKLNLARLIPQLTSENQRINQLLAVSQPCSFGNSSDNAESQLLPNTDGSRVIGENQVEDRVSVSLASQLVNVLCLCKGNTTAANADSRPPSIPISAQIPDKPHP